MSAQECKDYEHEDDWDESVECSYTCSGAQHSIFIERECKRKCPDYYKKCIKSVQEFTTQEALPLTAGVIKDGINVKITVIIVCAIAAMVLIGIAIFLAVYCPKKRKMKTISRNSIEQGRGSTNHTINYNQNDPELIPLYIIEESKEGTCQNMDIPAPPPEPMTTAPVHHQHNQIRHQSTNANIEIPHDSVLRDSSANNNSIDGNTSGIIGQASADNTEELTPSHVERNPCVTTRTGCQGYDRTDTEYEQIDETLPKQIAAPLEGPATIERQPSTSQISHGQDESLFMESSLLSSEGETRSSDFSSPSTAETTLSDTSANVAKLVKVRQERKA